MHAHDAHAAAQRFLAPLGPLALSHYTAPGERAEHLPGFFPQPWITALPLPVEGARTRGQTVALVDGADFHRETAPEAVAAAYQQRPRTRVYESINVRSDGWYSLAALHLARLLRHRVICTMYHSHTGDRALGPHFDHWFGVITQMQGAKRWLIWPRGSSTAEEVTTRAGDVLLLPAGLDHHVDTPADPGHSLHLVFAVTGEPLIDSTHPGAPHDLQIGTR